MTKNKEHFGTLLALSGTILSVTGALINNLLLDHVLAMWLWALSNPFLLVYTIGLLKQWWDGKISLRALIVMYAIFTVSNFIGLIL